MLNNLYIFDAEVFAYDNIWVFKNAETGEYHVFHNDNDGVKAFMDTHPLLVGYNNKHYDQYILKADLLGISPEEIKVINDCIIVQKSPGWQIPQLRDCGIYIDQFDLMDDTQDGTGLKEIEGHLGMSIKESSVDFNIDRPLTSEEVDEAIAYCKYDVDATEILLHLRKVYVENKLTLGREKGLSPARALYMTNAKLTATYLDAKPQEHHDEREYQYPDNLRREFIPQEVFEFFDKMYDPTISDEELFKSKLTIDLAGAATVIGFGGLHSALPNYRFKSEA